MKTMTRILTGLALCIATTAGAEGFKRITDEKTFRSEVVGKKILCGEKDFYTIRSNGRLTGRFGGETLKGAWEWRDSVMCRTLTTVRPGTDCQVIEVSANEVRGTRQRGKGRSFTCRFK